MLRVPSALKGILKPHFRVEIATFSNRDNPAHIAAWFGVRTRFRFVSCRGDFRGLASKR